MKSLIHDLVAFHQAKTKRKVDMPLMLVFPVLAGFLSIVLKLGFLESTLLFFFLPSVYLSYRYPEYIKKTLIFTLICSITFVTIIDYIAHSTGSWFVPSYWEGFRILDVIPIEDYIWGFGQIYFIVMFYESLLDPHLRPHIRSKTKYLLLGALGASVLFGYVFITQPHILNIPYFYFFGGVVVFVIPIMLLLLHAPYLWAKFSKVMLYFFYVSITHELTGLTLGHWSFPNESGFIGMVHIGTFVFPLEELVVWMLLTAIGILSYFEFFEEDL